MNNDDILSLIKKYNIDVSKWKKTVKKLLNEINEGSCVVFEKNNKLYREVKVAVIFCTFDDENYIAEQRVRSNEIEYILTEKIDGSENPINACIRGLKEELGFIKNVDYAKVEFISDYEEVKESSSYPGITGIFSYFAYYVKMKYKIKKQNFSRIDHDNKQLNFKLIKINEFTDPNKMFVKKIK